MKNATQQYSVYDFLFTFEQDNFYSVAKLWMKDAAYIQLPKNTMSKLREVIRRPKSDLLLRNFMSEMRPCGATDRQIGSD
jgi:hypothetical protein